MVCGCGSTNKGESDESRLPLARGEQSRGTYECNDADLDYHDEEGGSQASG